MVHDPISPDPDVVQAVEDFLPTADEIRRRSAGVPKLEPGSRLRDAEEQAIAELESQIATRADRLGLSSGALIGLLNAELNHRARRGRGEPSRPTTRTLLDRVSLALAEQGEADRAVNAARARQIAARQAVNDAQAAYAAHTKGVLA